MASHQASGDRNIQGFESTVGQARSEHSGYHANGDHFASNVMTSTSPSSQASSRKSGPTRPVQSCQFCRRRKIRCDKSTPSCTQCLKANTDCIYPMRKSRSQVSSLPNTASSQVREEQLLKRIGKLESAIQGLKVRGAEVVASPEVVSTLRYIFQHSKA